MIDFKLCFKIKIAERKETWKNKCILTIINNQQKPSNNGENEAHAV